MSVVGSGLQTLGSGISAAAPPVTQMVKEKLGENNINLDSLQNELETTLRQTGKPELQPENLQNKAEGEANNAQAQANDTANHLKTPRDLTTLESSDLRNDRLSAADRE